MHLSYHMLFHQYIVYTQVLVYCSLVSSPKYTKFLTCLVLLECWKLWLPFTFFCYKLTINTLLSHMLFS